MTENEREIIHPKDGALVAEEKERIKCAIEGRTAELRRKLRKIIADDPGKFPFYGA